MNKLKMIIAIALLLAMTCLLSGCLSYMYLNTVRKHQQETYCVVSLSPPYFKVFDAYLYDLSHEFNVGIYIVDDFAPGALNRAGEVVFSEEDYAEQIYAAYDGLEPYDDFVLLAIGNNVLQFGEGGKAFADITTGGRMKDVLTDNTCEKLVAKITEALDEAKITGEDEWDMSNISNDEYDNILYEYIEELKPYLENAME